MRTWWPVLAVTALALALAFGLGPGYAGYDASWSLVWGHEIAAGTMPSYEAAVAPTPHPLANAVATVLSPLGDGGEDALVALSFLSLAALAAGALTLAALLSWPAAGVIAAIVLISRGLLAREAAFASTDLPFLALVMWACALKVRRPDLSYGILVLLLLAGLLRPEAWLLSLVYVGWLARDHARRELLKPALLAIAAPVLWGMSDLLVTGDALHSLTGTRALAADLGRPTGLATAARTMVTSLSDVMGALPLAAGLLGLGAGLALAPRRFAIPAGVLVCGVATYLAIGAAGLPVLVRYLLLPTAMLAVTAAAGLALPWMGVNGRLRIVAWGVSAMIAGLLLAAIPQTVDGVRSARAFTAARGEVHRDLQALTSTRAFGVLAARCPEIRIPDFRTRPVLLLDASIDPGRLVVGNLADGERGLLITYASADAELVFNLGAQGEARRQALPSGGRLVGRNRSWLAAAVC